MDQNFMIDPKIIRRIVDAARIRRDEIVLEVGPGKGALTRELAKRAKEVIAVELDPELARTLRIPKTTVICGNVLEEIPKISFDKIISNIPYSISEPLVWKLIMKDFALGILTVPKGFAHILRARDGDPKFSRLSLVVQLFYDVNMLFDVPKTSFDPAPKVNSVVTCLSPKERTVIQAVIRQQKRKLKNALLDALCGHEKMTKSQSRKAIKSFKLNNLLEKKVREMSLTDLQKMVIKVNGHT